MLLFHSPRSKSCSIIFIIIVVHNEKLLLKYISHFCKFDVQTTKTIFFFNIKFSNSGIKAQVVSNPVFHASICIRCKFCFSFCLQKKINFNYWLDPFSNVFKSNK